MVDEQLSLSPRHPGRWIRCGCGPLGRKRDALAAVLPARDIPEDAVGTGSGIESPERTGKPGKPVSGVKKMSYRMD